MTGKRRLLVAGGATLVVVLAVAVITRAGGGSSDEQDSSTSSTGGGDLGFPAPEAGHANADREYLDGDGRVLLVMHERAKGVARVPRTAERCRQDAEELDQAASADEVLSRIGGLADPVLRDAFHGERTALGVALTECISGEASDDRAPQLDRAVEAVKVRLNELGD